MRQLFLGLTALLLACSGRDPTRPNDPTGPGVPSAVASITIEPVIGVLSVGRTLRLRVILLDAAGYKLANRTILFTSSNEQVLSVDAIGLVLAVGEGEATLTATSEGKSSRVRISVVPPEEDPCAGCWDYRALP